MSELLWTVIVHLLSILNKEYEWTALNSHRPFVICLEQGMWVNCSEQSSSICYLSWIRNMSELLWTVIVHLLSVLNKEYEWTALNSHRPFVICLEQGIWLNCFEQSSSICYLSWTRNMSELLWTVIVHLLSVLNKEYEWTALNSHRPFVICLEQGIWLNCFEQSSSIFYLSWTRNMSELLWTVIVHLLSVLNKEYEWTALNSHRPFVICLEQGIWMNCSEHSSSICYLSWTRNMSELLWTVIVHLLSVLNKEYEWTSSTNHRPFVIQLEQGIWVNCFDHSAPIVLYILNKHVEQLK